MNEKLNTDTLTLSMPQIPSVRIATCHALLVQRVAIIYNNALLAKYAYYSKHDMIPDDWFYSTIDDLWRSTALS